MISLPDEISEEPIFPDEEVITARYAEPLVPDLRPGRTPGPTPDLTLDLTPPAPPTEATPHLSAALGLEQGIDALDASHTTPYPARSSGSAPPTARVPVAPLSSSSAFSDEEPTVERKVPASVLAEVQGKGPEERDEEFRTVHVTFSEILSRVGPRHLGGPLPPIRDDLYTTTPAVEDGPPSTGELDEEWSDENKAKGSG